MDKRKVIYYTDEHNDEFSLTEITAKKIDGEYVYCYDSHWKRFTHFFWYRIVATPAAFIYTKIIFAHKIVGKEKLKNFKKTPYFMYGNHTQDIADAFIPSLLNFPKHNYVIVHPNNVSMPYLGKITPSLGALPLPDDTAAYKKFISAIKRRIGEGHTVVIYPEAHIWPYYTGIRDFPDTSFSYPIKYGTPVFCFTNTYRKRRFFKRPKIVTYIDGPFYPDKSLRPKEQRKDLRDRVYKRMCTRSKMSNAVQIEYVKKDENG